MLLSVDGCVRLLFYTGVLAVSSGQTVTITEYPVPTPNSVPNGIAKGPDGALWFTEKLGNKIGRITTGGAVTEYALPTDLSSPQRITTGPDNNLWFTEAANRIGRITTGGGIAEFSTPLPLNLPLGLTAGPDGALWFTNAAPGDTANDCYIGRITTSGAITSYPVPTPYSLPVGITAGPDGALWFTESLGPRIGRITTSGAVTEYPRPRELSSPWGIVAGPDGALWFADQEDSIGRITTSGSMTRYPLSKGSGPREIVNGPDGALWFVETSGNKIGRITTDGIFIEYPLPSASANPSGITLGPDGALWFTEAGGDFNPAHGNKIGRAVVTPAALTIQTASPLHDGTVGVAYSQNVTAMGGVMPYRGWKVTDGSLPQGISLNSVAPAGTAALSGSPTAVGAFTFTLQVTDGAGATAAKQFSLSIDIPTTLASTGIVNAASYTLGNVAPGEIVTMFGSFPGPSTAIPLQLDSRGYVSTNLGGAQVLFDGVPAPLIYALSGQISAVVPYAVGKKNSTLVQVSYQGQLSNSVAMPVSAVHPGVFTVDASGRGPGAILNQDGTVNSSGNPAPAGSFISVFATGEGQTNPGGVDGQPDASPAPQPIAQPVTATVGGVNAPVQYAGGVPGLVAGVLQVNVQIPQGVMPGGAVPIVLNIGGCSSQPNVTVAVR